VAPVQDDEPERTIFISPGRHLDAVLTPEVLGHYLVGIEGTAKGKRVEVGAEPVTIGRDAGQTLVFADTQVSRFHARVSLVNDEVVVEDLKSTNGTFVHTQRITTPLTLREGNVLRVGSQMLKYERRSRHDVKHAQELDRDLRKASSYVLSLLPAPLTTGPVRADWCFVPSTQLGGDAFGYDWLDQNTFVFYLLDVSGHGAGSAMHSVTVLNVLRQRALPDVDFRNPAEVLASLNARFQMDGHNGLYFTMWYGVYGVNDRTLSYSSGGHHPAYLVASDRREAQPLGSPALMVGALPDSQYDVHQTTVPASSALYLFSDGVFEIETRDQARWSQSDFLQLLLEPPLAGTNEAERLYQAVRRAARPGPLEDDFSLMVVTFV
jgi:serine phosphatase RsbU (regulator of sigma subunit)